MLPEVFILGGNSLRIFVYGTPCLMHYRLTKVQTIIEVAFAITGLEIYTNVAKTEK